MRRGSVSRQRSAPVPSSAPAAPAVDNAPAAADPVVRPRIRVLRGAEIALGPGKVALLEAVQAAGSLAAAAQRLEMSYMRAWKLVQTMNGCFREPLVELRRGGKAHGSAVLTAGGERVLALYRGMEEASREAMAGSWQELRSHLK